MTKRDDVPNIVEGFIAYLKTAGKEHLIGEIAEALRQKAATPSKNATVVSATEFKEADKVAIQKLLSEKYDVEKFSFAIDKGLIGGVKVVIGNQILDLSYRAKLEQLSQI